MGSARHKWQVIHGKPDPRSAIEAELRELLTELDRPLMSGFMAAGYSALGRYLFLSTMKRDSRDCRPPDAAMR